MAYSCDNDYCWFVRYMLDGLLWQTTAENLYGQSQADFDTELSLYRESVRREELILNEQTNDELQNLKIEIKRKILK